MSADARKPHWQALTPLEQACSRTRPIDNVLRLLAHFESLPLGAQVTLPQACRDIGMAHQVGYPIAHKLVEHGYLRRATVSRVTHYAHRDRAARTTPPG